MSLDDLVTVNISATTTAPSKPGFGRPMIAAYFPAARFGGARVRLYAKPADMVADGFLVTDPAYLCAAAICAENPKVKDFKIGRRALPPTQTLHLQCMSAVAGDVYQVTVGSTVVSYTVLGGATTSTVATAIAALIDPDPVAIAVAVADTITITTPAAGTLVDVKSWNSKFRFTDVTADPGIATDLAAIWAEDTDWYGLALDSNSSLEIQAAAAWTETNKRLFVPNNSDYGCKDPASTTDVMYVLKNLAYVRTGTLFAGSQLLCYSGASWMGNRLWDNPGDDTWSYKTLPGIPADKLTPSETNAIKNKAGNYYTTVANVNITLPGMSAGGEWFDTTRFIDWLQADIQVAVFGLFVNAKKIPFTDAGVDVIRSVVLAELTTGVNVGGLAGDPAPTVDAPKVATVSTIDRANRNFPGMTFSGRLAGAVHTLTLAGTLTV